MLNTSTMMLESLIFLFLSLDFEFIIGRKDVLLTYLCVSGTYTLIDFRKCLVNQHAILSTCMYCGSVLST